jgi:hypothetical protein
MLSEPKIKDCNLANWRHPEWQKLLPRDHTMTVTHYHHHHHTAIQGEHEGVDPNCDGTIQILGNDNDDDALDTDAGSEVLLTYFQG